MSNADVVRSFYEGIEGGNLPAALDLLAPDVAWTEMAGFPYAGTYHGRTPSSRTCSRIGSEWDGFRFDLDEVVEGRHGRRCRHVLGDLQGHGTADAGARRPRLEAA